MARTVTDENLLRWEVFPSGGDFGLPQQPQIVFQCISDFAARPRSFVLTDGDEATAEQSLAAASPARLRELLAGSRELY